MSQIVAEFGGPTGKSRPWASPKKKTLWSRYAFKMATGSGKTKVMSLAIVWSYFHALRESDSDLARHFVVIAPNLTVFERLKEDFKPPRAARIFSIGPADSPGMAGRLEYVRVAAGRSQRRGHGRHTLSD